MNISIEEKELFDALHNERVQDIKTFNKPDYKGLWGGVIDKYKEKAHFIYELIQNADDVEASRVEFKLEKDKLLFRHNGKIKFSISSVDDTKNKGHINAITAIGNSTKDESKGNTIGKFGVGFKAVFQYTKEPRIYDDKFWFKIEQFIIPTELSFDFKDRKKGETVFEFPFSSPQIAYSEIKERLQNLNNPILFLQNLKKINVTITGEDDIIYSKKLIESNEHGNIKHELFSIKNNKLSQKLHLFTKNVVIDDEKGKEISQYISAGYFLKNNGDIDTSNDQKVFCFFPTAENFRLKCVVHAPFLLVDNRQQLKEENLNYELKNLLAKLASEALPILRDRKSVV